MTDLRAESSTISESSILDSNSTQLEANIEKIEELHSSTVEQSFLQSQTETLREACRSDKEAIKTIFTRNFLQLLRESDFEFGYKTPADDYVEDAINSYGTFAREWVNAIFLQHIDQPQIISLILRVIAHFDYFQMYPQGTTMAAVAINHIDADVRECGVRCFENWEAPENIPLLKNISFSEEWLNEYLTDVLTDLEDLGA